MPEAGTSRRFSVSLSVDGRDLVVRIDARDLSALRAAINSYGRWAQLLVNLDKLV